MKIEKLSDSALHSHIKALVAREREILAEVLKHLLEVEVRKLFSKFGYPSLFEYVRQELGYSEDAAYRRIAAMRALREIPRLEEKITSGAMTLSNIAAVQTVIRAESKACDRRLPLARKLELFDAVENKSKREAEKSLHDMTTASKEMLRPEKVRVVDESIEYRFVANANLQAKIQAVKTELSHVDPTISIADLFARLCDEFLERRERKKAARTRDLESAAKGGVGEISAAANVGVGEDSAPAQKVMGPPESGGSAPARHSTSARKPISARIRRLVMQRAGWQCEKCGSTWQLEIDHRHPLALGGTDHLDNLRVLCRNCNSRSAVESLGKRKIQRYVARGME